MLITRRSILTQIERTLEIPVTRTQLTAWINGTFIQIAMPNLTANEREFLMTGVVQEEWDEFFIEEDGIDALS